MVLSAARLSSSSRRVLLLIVGGLQPLLERVDGDAQVAVLAEADGGRAPARTALRIVASWHAARRAAAPVVRSGRLPQRETLRLALLRLYAFARSCLHSW